jgi:hypothetical protein
LVRTAPGTTLLGRRSQEVLVCHEQPFDVDIDGRSRSGFLDHEPNFRSINVVVAELRLRFG